MVLIKINNIDFTLVNKEKLSSIVEGKYDVTKNSIALGDLGEDKELIEKAIPLIFIREFNQEISFFKGKDGKTLLPDMRDLYLMDGFNKQLSRDSFSNNYEKLYLYNIGEQVLEIDSIVDNRRGSLYLMEGFNQPIVFTVGSIPNSINQVHFTDGFNQPIFKDLIPNGVSVSLYNIGTFPDSIKYFRFSNKYCSPLPKGMIPEGVEKLELSDKNVNIPLSIPSTVKELTLSHGFNHPLVKGIIPCGVEKMSIYSIGEDALLEESVPDSVKYAFLGFNSDQAYSHFFPSLKK
ncbi:hypothetical protein ACTFIW_007160 [Dictyostelium discoideum]